MNMILFFIIQVLVAGAILLFIRFFFSSQLTGAMKKLQVLNKENLVREAQVKEELKKAKLDRRAKLEEGSKLANQTIDEAKDDANRIRERAKEEANLEAQRLIQEAKDESERLRLRIETESRQVAQQWAKELTASLFNKDTLKTLHNEVVDGVLKELEAVEDSKLSSSSNEIHITTAVLLTKEQESRVATLLKKKLGKAVEVVQETNKDLIAGLLIHLSDQVIDGSLNNRFDRGIEVLANRNGKKESEEKAA